MGPIESPLLKTQLYDIRYRLSSGSADIWVRIPPTFSLLNRHDTHLLEAQQSRRRADVSYLSQEFRGRWSVARRRRTNLRATYRSTTALFAILLCTLSLLPVASLASAGTPSGAALRAAGSGPAGFYGQVTWNGANVASASSTSSALGIQFSNTAHLYYNWSSTATLYNINVARLQILDFGFALATRTVTLESSLPGLTGGFALNWTPGTLQYVIEGVYRLTASLVAVNGSSVWTENFFVHATAPLSILAVFPIVLILIAIYELYNLAYVGRQAARGQPRTKPPTSASSSSEATQPGEDTQPPTEGSTPPPSEGTP
ncbi:MAG: hypothetical protein WAN87_07540 [Thermoplasmata archaeon]